jgi:tetratricopeptide (TPR) repeat protein
MIMRAIKSTIVRIASASALALSAVESRSAPPGADDVNRGVRLARTGAAAEALAAFERAARRNPGLPEAHLGRGLLLAQAANHAEAQAAFQHALALDPEMPEALEGMALSLLQENRNREAVTAYERVIGRRAASADTHFNHAVALARLGERERAAQACRQAIRLRPEMTQARALLKEIER